MADQPTAKALALTIDEIVAAAAMIGVSPGTQEKFAGVDGDPGVGIRSLVARGLAVVDTTECRLEPTVVNSTMQALTTQRTIVLSRRTTTSFDQSRVLFGEKPMVEEQIFEGVFVYTPIGDLDLVEFIVSAFGCPVGESDLDHPLAVATNEVGELDLSGWGEAVVGGAMRVDQSADNGAVPVEGTQLAWIVADDRLWLLERGHSNEVTARSMTRADLTACLSDLVASTSEGAQNPERLDGVGGFES